MKTPVRVRFAPSPTGFMHLGNVRTALINYLFAQHHNGTFIVRVEDTDKQRMFDLNAKGIIQDLKWLNLIFQEGPLVGGPYAPYYQSERNALYQEYLQTCIQLNKVYRCFCTAEDLEKKRERQIAQKLPPRYDRACLALTREHIQKNVAEQIPFIWRFKLADTSVTITDLARGSITYDLKHFSDFAVTRQDGSCTFIFANFVDDVVMEITHVIRGEDHLSNTANQAALYYEFKKTLPVFWHLPIITNTDGKKLSKRDFGFSLNDLRNAGYLPEAITNYLALLGASFKTEIMSLQEISQAFDFEHITSTGQIKYDTEKLRWVNQKWIQRLSFEDFKQRIQPLLTIPSDEKFDTLLMLLKPEIVTLNDITEKTQFYLHAPEITRTQLSDAEKGILPFFIHYVHESQDTLSNPELFVKSALEKAKEQGFTAKPLYALMRFALTGHTQGLGIKDLILLLGAKESYKRFSNLTKL